MPPILQNGFRPFFFAAAVHASMSVPVWLWAYLSGVSVIGPFASREWHIHEMLFGYLGAVIAGFVLTAVPNWTGRLPLAGPGLAALAGLWFAGRAACAFWNAPIAVIAVDLAFPAALSFSIWREVAAGRNWKNLPVAVMITLFGAANALDHLGSMGHVPHDIGWRLAIAVAVMLMALIGGRIIPSFTRNWMVREGHSRLPHPFGRIDRLALVTTALAVCVWLASPDAPIAGTLLVASGLMLGLRLLRWRGHHAIGEPILFVLHLGYAWLSAGLALLGFSILSTSVPASSSIHALTAGAFGTMTMAVMTRASLGHTGRLIVADRFVAAMYVLVTIGAALRVAAPFSGSAHAAMLVSGGTSWSAAFLLFAIRFCTILWSRRAGK